MEGMDSMYYHDTQYVILQWRPVWMTLDISLRDLLDSRSLDPNVGSEKYTEKPLRVILSG